MFKEIIQSLTENLPSFNYDSTNDYVFVKHDFNHFTLVFKVEYLIHYTNIIEATYDSPKEFDVEYEFQNCCDIAIYSQDEEVELTNDQLNQIHELITQNF